MEKKFTLKQIERLLYIWARYEGTRTKNGKEYSSLEIGDLARRLNRFKDNPDSFDEGFEKGEY